jgi:hypothetical protein
MNISILIPQLFYDLIGRVIPGATLISCAFFLFKGPAKGLQILTTWSFQTNTSVPSVKSGFILLGTLLASYIVGSLLGGIWFRVYRLDILIKDPTDGCKHSRWLRWMHGFSKSGEMRIDNALKDVVGTEAPVKTGTIEIATTKMKPIMLGTLDMAKIRSTHRIALIYDYLQLCAPKTGARIAKLRAEQLMSGVLMIGFLILAALLFFFSSAKDLPFSFFQLELILLFAALTAGWLAWHLEKRSSSALCYSWFLVWSGIVKENDYPSPRKDDQN